MTGGEISGNSLTVPDDTTEAYPTADGGGVYLTDSSFTMYGGAISGNAAWYGGGVSAWASTVDLLGGMISENEAYFSGGGLYFAGADYEADNSYTLAVGGAARIENNVAGDGYGGGIYMYYATLVMTGGTVSGNQAGYDNQAGHGGGIAAYY